MFDLKCLNVSYHYIYLRMPIDHNLLMLLDQINDITDNGSICTKCVDLYINSVAGNNGYMQRIARDILYKSHTFFNEVIATASIEIS